MSWVRCPRCLTYGNSHHSPTCLLCGEPWGDLDRPALLEPPEVEREVQKDVRKSRWAVVFLGVVGFTGVISIASSQRFTPLQRMSLLGAVCLGGIIGLLTLVGTPGPVVETFGRVVIRIFVVAGILMLVATAIGIALIIYLFILCSSGHFP